jgi:NHLM bacteriocin system ABC transporter peptidase/ATP-binding protein
MKFFTRVARVPTILQMEAVECGSASLAMILSFYGKNVPLEELRIECGVSRDGSKASNIIKAGKKYGLDANGFRIEPEELKTMKFPMIIHWNFNHFVVLEGFYKDKVYINDPDKGKRILGYDEFDQSFTGVALTFEPTDKFVKEGKKKDIVTSLRNLLKGSETPLLCVVLFGVALVIPGLVIPVFSKIFVDDILLKEINSWIKPLLIAMGITVVLKALLNWLQQYYLVKLETKIALSGSAKFFWHILHLPIDFFTQRYAGEIGTRIAISDKIASLLSGRLATAFLDFIMIFFYGILLIQYDWVLTLAGFLIAMLNLAAFRYISRNLTEQNLKMQMAAGKMMGVAMGGLQMIETLKSSGNESDFFSKWSGYQAQTLNTTVDVSESAVYLNTIPILLTSINTAVILIIGGFRVLDGYLTLGMLIAFQSLMGNFIDPINRLVALGGEINQIKADISRIDDVYNYKADICFDNPVPYDENSPVKLEGYLEIKDLSFGYNKLEPPLIENFNLTLKPGSRVALVGSSGSGKSTVSKLISGVYSPWSGQILFDGKERKEYPREVINNSLAVVDQDISIFEGTVKDNITLWDATIAETDIITSAKDACIHDDISVRNGGYNYKFTEDGRNFSGGQRQRLEIARALSNNPRILVLDEATSALDTKTEKLVDENIRRRGCTCVIVAHRLSTIRDCDEIIVLQKGKIVQRGTHEELMKIEGLYATLIKAQ